MNKKIAQIIPLVNLTPETNQVFSYLIPKRYLGQIKIGQQIIIPFRNKNIKGIVLSIKKDSITKKYRLKSISKIVDEEPNLDLTQIKLAKWIAQYYYASLGVTTKLFLTRSAKKRVKRETIKKYNKSKFPKLTKDQNKVLNSIRLSPSRYFLLHGVTGSGKTEIYMQLIKDQIKKQKQSLVLIPEISITPQTIQRFSSRFSKEIIAVLHSRLSPGERFEQWQRIKNLKAKIIIGPRSAVFAPFQKLGLIIMDEEHDPSFKQFDLSPRYHARDVAQKLAEIFKAKIIFGSATPSVETYFKAKQGKIKLLELRHRYTSGQIMPKVIIVDMKEEVRKRNFSIFSDLLTSYLAKTLKNKKQALLFLNRRGLSTFVICQDCGFIEKCPRCSVPLIYHVDEKEKSDEWLCCHHCNFRKKPSVLCPKCKGHQLKYRGCGTQKVQLVLEKIFPQAKISRLDSDIARKQGYFQKIYEDFVKRKFDLLVGTQMIAKSWDMPGVDLVGIVSADSMLNLPDFRSSERTFQLLCQVAGRSGRRRKQGLVILQTTNPKNYVIKTAAKHDFKSFYNKEIKERKKLNWPPFCQLIRLIYRGKNNERTERKANELANTLRNFAKRQKGVKVVGPAPCFIAKVKENFRWQIILKLKIQKTPLSLTSQKAKLKLLNLVPKGWKIDIDPESLL